MAATTADLVQKFIRLEDDRRSKSEDLDKIKEELSRLEPELIARFENAGMQRMGALGHTVFLHRQLWARSTGETALTVQALKDAHLDDLVEEKFNTNRLSAYVREQAKVYQVDAPLSPEEIVKILPKPLQTTVDVTEKISLRSKKG